MEQAQLIKTTNQTVKGFISWNDEVDYYKVKLPKAGRITVDVTSYLDIVKLDLIDKNQNKIWNDSWINYGMLKNPKKWKSSIDLKAGTYYIAIKKYSDYTGKYNIQVNFSTLIKTAPTVKTVKSTSTKITGKTEPNSTVYAYIGNKKIGSSKANSKGSYLIKVKKQKVKTKIKVFAKNSAGKSPVRTVVVKK